MDKTLFLGQQLKALRWDVRALFEYIQALSKEDLQKADQIVAQYDKRCYWANKKSEGKYKKDKKPWNK